MEQQTYPVKCECGVVHQCPAGYAGTRFACKCGKVVEVPVLSALRTTVIEGQTTPEAEVEARSRLGQLPLEQECVICARPTAEQVTVVVECKRHKERMTFSERLVLRMFTIFGWFGLLFWVVARKWLKRDVMREYIAYELPVRACEVCGSTLTSSVPATEAVKLTPLYARLLASHPNAFVIASSALPGRRFPNPYRNRRRRRWLMAWSGIASCFAFFASTMWIGRDYLWPMVDLGPKTGPPVITAFVVVALAGAVLTGWGVCRLVGHFHRVYFPDEL